MRAGAGRGSGLLGRQLGQDRIGVLVIVALLKGKHVEQLAFVHADGRMADAIDLDRPPHAAAQRPHKPFEAGGGVRHTEMRHHRRDPMRNTLAAAMPDHPGTHGPEKRVFHIRKISA